jgi:hypothetical protein
LHIDVARDRRPYQWFAAWYFRAIIVISIEIIAHDLGDLSKMRLRLMVAIIRAGVVNTQVAQFSASIRESFPKKICKEKPEAAIKMPAISPAKTITGRRLERQRLWSLFHAISNYDNSQNPFAALFGF